MKNGEKIAKRLHLDNKMIVLLFSFLMSVCVLIVGSNNSFLFKYNDCVDLNWFLTMGNGLLSGKIPYKDLFEQKGPILYFVFAFICLFKNPFIVVWILEVIAFTFFLYFSFFIAKRFLTTGWSYLANLIIATLVVSSGFFLQPGGAVEEFFLPVLAYLLFCLFEFKEDWKLFNKRRSLCVGVIVAIMFWVKFTVLILPIVMLLIWFVINLKRKNFKNTFVSIFMMLCGFLIVSCPILNYFFFNDALIDLIKVYFYLNMFGYASTANATEKVQQFARNSSLSVFVNIFQVAVSFIVIAIGLIYIIKTKKKGSVWYALLLLASLLIQVLIKMYIYYFLLYEIFAIVGIAYILNSVSKCKLNKLSKVILNLLICSTSLFVAVFGANHTKQLFIEKDEYPQVYFSKVIKSYNIDDYSVFCYRMLDYGFYNAAEVVPNEYYYAMNNFSEESLPEMFEAFDLAVKDAHADFVIAFIEDYKQNFGLFNSYELIAEKQYTRYKTNFRYENLHFVLLKRI